MASDQPDYYYANQWADELASAYTMMSQTAPALSFDLAAAPVPSAMKADMATAVMRSNINPYQ